LDTFARLYELRFTKNNIPIFHYTKQFPSIREVRTNVNAMPTFISLKTKCIHFLKILRTILRKTKLGDEEHVIKPKN